MSESESGNGAEAEERPMLGRLFFGFCDRSVILTYIGIVFSIIGIFSPSEGS